ncbi:unnamed protein product, partial [Polarella glacialis]
MGVAKRSQSPEMCEFFSEADDEELKTGCWPLEVLIGQVDIRSYLVPPWPRRYEVSYEADVEGARSLGLSLGIESQELGQWEPFDESPIDANENAWLDMVYEAEEDAARASGRCLDLDGDAASDEELPDASDEDVLAALESSALLATLGTEAEEQAAVSMGLSLFLHDEEIEETAPGTPKRSAAAAG